MRGAFLIWMCLTAIPSLVAGQVSGVITDTIWKRRVPGAVVTVLDSARRVIKRSLADDSGRFRIENVAAAARVRIVKIGYRPLDLAASAPSSLRIVMERLPDLLEPVRTSDQPRCSRNATRPAAFGLWEQARAALLGTVLAREANTAEVRRLNFRRYMTPRGDEIALQTVHRESSLSLRSFEAAHPADVFMRHGFVESSGGNGLDFFGPDAEVLLDDALVEHYCLELATPRIERPTQVGLRFRPMIRARGRVDVDGTLWIDTLARVLKDIEYGYMGLESWANPWRPGGVIGFVETSPATVWIDHWTIRMTGAAIDSGQRIPTDWSPKPFIVEGGAELASARWPDGREWKATFGVAYVRLVGRLGSAVANARMQLDSTDYDGITDASGGVIIDELLPGPYRVSVFDSTLAVVDTTLPGSTGFTAVRGKTLAVQVSVPTLREFVADGCKDQDVYDEQSYLLIARIVIGDDSVPAAGVKWRLEPAAGEESGPREILAEGQSGRDGMVYFCKRLVPGRRVVLRAWSPADRENRAQGSSVKVTMTIRNQVTATKLAIPR